MNSTHCPKCSEDIGVWSIYKAALPHLLRCPSCNAKIRYRPSGWLMVIIAFVVALPFFALVIYANLIFLDLSRPLQIAVSLAQMLIIWLPFEYYFVYRLRKSHELVLREK